MPRGNRRRVIHNCPAAAQPDVEDADADGRDGE
jgi:hypothetical protein